MPAAWLFLCAGPCRGIVPLKRRTGRAASSGKEHSPTRLYRARKEISSESCTRNKIIQKKRLSGQNITLCFLREEPILFQHTMGIRRVAGKEVFYDKRYDKRLPHEADSGIFHSAFLRFSFPAAIQPGGYGDCGAVSGHGQSGGSGGNRFHQFSDHRFLHGCVQRIFHSLVP